MGKEMRIPIPPRRNEISLNDWVDNIQKWLIESVNLIHESALKETPEDSYTLSELKILMTNPSFIDKVSESVIENIAGLSYQSKKDEIRSSSSSVICYTLMELIEHKEGSDGVRKESNTGS